MFWMKSYTYRIIIEPDGENYHGFVPALVGCHTYGSTIAETKKNLHDAMSLYIEHLREKGTLIPEENSLESFDTIVLA